MKLKDWLREWLNVCVKYNVKLKTYNMYKDIVELHIIPSFEGVEVNDLDYEKILKFIAEKKTNGNLKTGVPLSRSSVNGIIIVFKSAISEAVDFSLIEKNPFAKVKKQKGDQKQVRALTTYEQKKIEKHVIVSKNRNHTGILIALYTGLRIGELLALTWSDIDFLKNVLIVNKTISSTKDYDNKSIVITQKPKTASSHRVVPLPSGLCHMLKNKKKLGGSLVIENNKKQLTIRGYQYMFERLMKKLKIRKVGFHALRHTFATRALECGFDIKTLSEIVGHSSVATTINLYAHSQRTQKKLMMEKLNKIYPVEFNE